jgi:putative flippase GtrA
LSQFLKFCIVGTFVFGVDAVIFSLLLHLGLEARISRSASIALCVFVSWLCNRAWTFRDSADQRARFHEFVRFAGTQMLGAGTNACTSLLVLSSWPGTRDTPWLVVAVGSIAGLLINYCTAKWIAFGKLPEMTN